jgi:zinc protease
MPISGYVDDVKKLTVNDLTAFYLVRAAPSNAILIVAGDTTVDQVRKLAERHYGPVPARWVDAVGRPRVLPTCRSAWSAPTRAWPSRAGRGTIGAVLPQGRDPARLCAAGAGAPAGRRRDQPTVARPGGRQQARALGVGVLQPGQPRPHLVRPAASAPQSPMVEIESAVGSQLGKLIDDA